MISAEGKKQQEAILTMLATLPDTMFNDRKEFEADSRIVEKEIIGMLRGVAA